MIINNRTLTLITGIPRSGTTALAEYCDMMGLDIQGGWQTAMYPAGYEDLVVRDINDRIKNSGDDPRINEDIISYSAAVIKEPRFVTLCDPRLIKKWFRLRPEMKLIVMVRDFTQAACSMERTQGIKTIVGATTTQEAAKILEAQLDSFMETIERLGVSYEVIHHPEFIDQFDHVYYLLTKFAGHKLVANESAICKRDCSLGSPKDVWKQWFNKESVKKY